MPLFFLDCYNGRTLTRDFFGLEFDDCQAAKHEAVGMLPDLARESPPHTDSQIYTVDIRTPGGEVIYTASLSFTGRWLKGMDPLPDEPAIEA